MSKQVKDVSELKGYEKHYSESGFGGKVTEVAGSAIKKVVNLALIREFQSKNMFLFRLASLGLVLLLTACQSQDPEPAPQASPKFLGVATQDVDKYQATLTAQLSGELGEAQCYFEFYRTETVYEKLSATVQDGAMTCIVKDLVPNTQYKFRALIDNLNGQLLYSGLGSFVTKQKDPVPVSGEAIDIEDAYLKKWLVLRFDQNSDGEISSEEAKQITKVEVLGDSILSVKGIECMPNLVDLQLGGYIHGTTGSGQLTEVDVTNNPALLRLGVEGNKLHAIDISQNLLLENLAISRNPIEEITIKNHKNLTFAALSCLNVKTVDLRGLDKLQEVHVDGNTFMEELLLDNKMLTYIDCSGSGLTELDISKCPLLNAFTSESSPSLTIIYMSRKQAVASLHKDAHTQIQYVD